MSARRGLSLRNLSACRGLSRLKLFESHWLTSSASDSFSPLTAGLLTLIIFSDIIKRVLLPGSFELRSEASSELPGNLRSVSLPSLARDC